MRATILGIPARVSVHRRRVLRVQDHIVHADLIAWVSLGARDTRRLVLDRTDIPPGAHEGNIGETHETRPLYEPFFPLY